MLTDQLRCLVRLRIQHADIVPLDDQAVNLLQAEVPAASAVIVPFLLFLRIPPLVNLRRSALDIDFTAFGFARMRETLALAQVIVWLALAAALVAAGITACYILRLH